MLRLVEHRQFEIGEIDQHRLELAVFGGDAVKPLGDFGAAAAGTGAADDGVEFQGHAEFLLSWPSASKRLTDACDLPQEGSKRCPGSLLETVRVHSNTAKGRSMT